MNANDKVKALVVLGLIGSIVSDCQKVSIDKVKKQADKIARWHVDCVEKITGVSQSGKAERQLRSYSKRVFKARVEILGDKVTAESITQELIAADGMINWLSTKHHLKSKEWRYLKQTLNSLVVYFVDLLPEREDWELYEKLDDIVRI